MSYSNPNTELTYNGSTGGGTQTNFAVNFYYLEGDPAILVERWDYTDPTNPTKDSFVEGVDYTIDESGYPSTEVNTTDPLPVTHKLIIYRTTDTIQTSSFINGSFPAESVEETFDRNMMATQEKESVLNRAIINPIHDPTAFEYTDLVALDTSVDTNTADIATNLANIGTNASNIATNASGVSTNAGGIATNVSAIAGHETRIDDLEGQISSITAPVIYSIAGAEVYNADTADTVIIDTNDTVQINLPAATSGYFVRVKVSEKIDDVTIVAASSIDGFGTTYTVSSEYESISLVSDGTKWYII